MKRDLLDILACPLCKGDLTPEVFEENEKEIVTGKLCCPSCRECYPIEDGIPNMLPPDLRDLTFCRHGWEDQRGRSRLAQVRHRATGKLFI